MAHSISSDSESAIVQHKSASSSTLVLRTTTAYQERVSKFTSREESEEFQPTGHINDPSAHDHSVNAVDSDKESSIESTQVSVAECANSTSAVDSSEKSSIESTDASVTESAGSTSADESNCRQSTKGSRTVEVDSKLAQRGERGRSESEECEYEIQSGGDVGTFSTLKKIQ